MIPDKLYLVKDAANPEGIFDTVASKKPMFQDDVCYIRKDALIEWLSKCKNNPTITDLQKDNIQELIDKIDSI